MPISLTLEELLKFNPCNPDRHRKLFATAGTSTLTASQAFAAGATISDILWVAGRLGYKRECVQIAVFAARQVAHLNSDSRVAAAIDAAQEWIENSFDAAFDAADAADAAYDAARDAHAAYDAARDADAADAAHAAAYAAYAAYAAADAAYNAADAAYNADAAAAYAAAYAADAAIRKEIERIFG